MFNRFWKDKISNFKCRCIIQNQKHDHALLSQGSHKSLATLTLGSSKINQHCWRFHGSGVIAAPKIIGLISFCTGMHHEYFFEVANVFSCSPFMFENTENKQLDWRIRHSHLVSTLFHSLVRWWRPRRIRPQITRLSQLENSAMGTWQFTRTLLYQTGSKNGVI